jgi:hypothetical protein
MIGFLISRYKMALGSLVVALTALLGVLLYGWSQKREGVSEALTEALRGDAKKLEKAREAAYKEKRDVDGISTSDLANRLRRRGDDWGRL